MNVDEHYHYFVPQEQSKETQYVRLALHLYEEGKTALTLRTLEFFEKEFPGHNEFKTEMQFLRAASLIRLGLNADAETVLQGIVADAAGTEEALQASFYLIQKSLEKRSYLAALNDFLTLIQKNPNSPLLWVFHLGAAECYYSMKNVDLAAKEYRWVMTRAPNLKAKAEAAAKIGDLYSGRLQYEQALAIYFQSLKYFKTNLAEFPELYLNRSEALYQIGAYEKAKVAFIEFLKDYPSHPQGWRATFRLGEIFARRSRVGADLEQSQKWFYETINRYPFSPGVVLSRIRLSPCEDHGKFDFTSLQKFYTDEATAIRFDENVHLKDYNDFKSLAYARSLISLGTAEQVVEAVLQALPNVKNQFVRSHLSTMAHYFFKKEIEARFQKQQEFDVLSFYSQYSKRLPRPENVIEIDYLLTLSQTALGLGLSQMYQELLGMYRELTSAMMVRLNALESPVQQNQNGPDLVLRKMEETVASAKGIWVLNRNLPVGAWIQQVRDHLLSVADDSEYTYEKELILGLADEKEGKSQSALRHALSAQLIQSNPFTDYWLASLQVAVGSLDSAIIVYDDLMKKYGKALSSKDSSQDSRYKLEVMLGLPPVPSLRTLLLQQGELFEKQGRWGEAALVYLQGIKDKEGVNPFLYKYANSLFNTGDPLQATKAKQVLEELIKVSAKDSSDPFWKRLAESKLANEKVRESLMNHAKEGI